MSTPVGIPLTLALLAASPAHAGVNGSAAATSPQEAKAARDAVTPTQLSRYAAALVEIEVAREAIKAQEAAAPAPQRATLAGQARSETLSILQRNDLDPNTFNAISRAVEADPMLQQKVRQAMMDRVVGT